MRIEKFAYSSGSVELDQDPRLIKINIRIDVPIFDLDWS